MQRRGSGQRVGNTIIRSSGGVAQSDHMRFKDGGFQREGREKGLEVAVRH